MINILYNTINTALNKNQMGKISPFEYNSALTEVLNKLYSELFSDTRKLLYKKMRFQDASGFGNESFNLKQVLEYYLSSKFVSSDSNGLFTIPKDMNFVKAIFDEEVLYEKVDVDVFNTLIRSSKFRPTKCSAIYTLNESISIFPKVDKIEINYFRKIKQPKWTYKVVNNTEMFNADANDFQDIDMHPSMLSKIFIDVLLICGLNLQNDQVSQYVNTMKQEELVNKQ